MYSWLSENMDVVVSFLDQLYLKYIKAFISCQGFRSALIYFGFNFGTMLMPPAGGYLFKWVDPMAVWYLNFGCVLCQIVSTLALESNFKNKIKAEDKKVNHENN